MQTVDTKVDCCPFTGFDNFFLYLFAYFGHHFLNTCRMDTSVCHQLVKSQTGNFTANRVKSGKNDCFRSVVYNDFNAGSGFQCADIASFTSDDTSFDFIRFDMEYRYGIFDGSFGSYRWIDWITIRLASLLAVSFASSMMSLMNDCACVLASSFSDSTRRSFASSADRPEIASSFSIS